MKSAKVTGLAICAVLVGGSLNGGGATGRGLFSSWTRFNTRSVFAAAPINWILSPDRNVGFTSRKAPPPYVNTALSKLQFEQLRPSSCWVWLGGTVILSMIMVEIPGTCGTAPPIKIPIYDRFGPGAVGEGDCAQVDVWMAADMANALQAPTINDPNATVTLDMTPSPNGSDCSVWHYHYLKHNEKPPSPPFVQDDHFIAL